MTLVCGGKHGGFIVVFCSPKIVKSLFSKKIPAVPGCGPYVNLSVPFNTPSCPEMTKFLSTRLVT